MTRLVVTTDADADFDDILVYLQRVAGAHVAADYARRFNLTLERLIEFPQSGAPRSRLGPNARIAIVSPYILIYDYRMADDAVVFLRILQTKYHTRPRAPRMMKRARRGTPMTCRCDGNLL
jgi:toxin ParE1/3/4